MLGTSGDGLITKLTSYLTTDKEATPNTSPYTPDQECEPHPAFATTTPHDAETTSNDRTEMSASQPSKASSRRSLKRTASELVIPSQERDGHLTAIAALEAVRSKEDGRRTTRPTPFPTRGQLRPSRPSSQRSISNSRYELKSQYHDPNISSASLQKQLVEQTKPMAERPRNPDPNKSQINKGARPSPIRSTAMRSKSEPDPARAFADPKTRRSNMTLKPCIKKKAKSTTTTPPTGLRQETTDAELKTLRRVKTVDFEETGSNQSLSLPEAPIKEEISTQTLASDTGESSRSTEDQTESVKPCPSCPDTMNIAKSTAAEPATTRTDVHVIAIAPSWDAQGVTHDDSADPATPIMQIIETKSGSYEVIWDDVPEEHTIKTRGRRSSSASHALETASPSAKRGGLDRVNSKLTGWSGTWNSPSYSFKPTVVVFPDDDGRATRYDCAVDDDEDLAAIVPPNSRITSGAHSSVSSRPVSAPLTRSVSCEESSLRDALQVTPPHVPVAGSSPPSEHSLVVPSVEIPHSRGRNTKPAPMIRKLSNLEEADTKFRDHRDSVTIAHSRIVHSGGVSSELFPHRDSVSLRKKRMRARNHAASKARSPSRRKELSVEALGLFTDEDISTVTLPTVKEHAAQALRNSSSSSILHPPQQTGNKRHIRIVE
ncbi:hypothetical protein BKA58DRAFT_139655 [Alternaria rosae]|uniref:uncharacterized protein n=1 Tax=Alternaria rosae TaxID=1187941 RepID=UPI001E8DE8FE|nr:uncharacterized protein BKA58DRAFT_139655 [Alternaria rosae]KAH6872137.1 hypothetical protein BKA58DRAFT_139655 [Alternaria rosae]